MPEFITYNPEKKENKTYNFILNISPEITKLLEKSNFQEKLQSIRDNIDSILGENATSEETLITLFSDKKQYLDYLQSKFPTKYQTYSKDNAVFNYDKNSKTQEIISFTPIPKISPEDLNKLQQANISLDEAKKIIENTAYSNIISSVAHEMTRLHSFFGKVGNDASDNKWEQEQICVFIGEKIRTKEGNTYLREIKFKQAQEELIVNQDVNLEKDGYNWKVINKYEEFFYPYLEKKEGLFKLQTLWKKLFKDKIKFNKALNEVYQIDPIKLKNNFIKSMLEAKTYKEIEL